MRARHAAAPFALALLTATLVTVGFAPPAQAATIEVTTTDDEDDGAGDCPGPDCSLREALWAAGDGDVVVLAADTTYELTLGHLQVGAAGLIVIEGNGATIEQTGDNARVIYRTDGDLTIRDLTVTGGNVQAPPAPDFAHGGGIRFYGDGTLTLERSLVVGNEASGDGGGIHATRIRLVDSAVVQNSGENGGGISLDLGGLLELTRSRVLGNVAETTGGGIYAGDPGPDLTITIEASTISQNTGEAVGGMYVREGDATIVNTSFLDNVATGRDSIGGLYVGGAATLRYVTLAGNEGEDAGNLGAQELQPFAVALAEPVGAPSCSIGAGGTASGGYNVADDASCGLTDPTDQPDLASLGLGPIPMHLDLHRPPLAGSPLLDVVPAVACAGPDGDLVGDQLSTPRPQGLGCDAGAIEVVVATQPTPTTQPSPTTAPGAPPAPPAVPASAAPTFTG